MKKLLITLICIIAGIGLIGGVISIVGPEVDSGGYRYVIAGMLKSYIVPTNEQVAVSKNKAGGIIHGICHPKHLTKVGSGDDYYYVEDASNAALMQEANINWVRFDLTSTVLDENGQETRGYKDYKKQAQAFKDAGFKVMCITCYPSEYLFDENFGGNEATNTYSTHDPRTQVGLQAVAADAKYLIQDLQGIVDAIQVTNEMTVNRFREPLNLDEAAEYIRVQLRAMKDYKQDILVGYNVADFTMYNLYEKLSDCNDCCDYLGVDLYLGCFESSFKDLFIYDFVLRGFYGQSHLPMIINEFGYIGHGEAKTAEQKDAYIAEKFGDETGIRTEAQAIEQIQTLVGSNSFTVTLRNRLLKELLRDDYLGDSRNLEQLATLTDAQKTKLANMLFDPTDTNTYYQHFYQSIRSDFCLNDYPHSEEGQARFYTDVITEHFAKMPFMLGCFAYMWQDSGTCYICGEAECPVETGWGMLDNAGEKNPCFDALKAAYGSWN